MECRSASLHKQAFNINVSDELLGFAAPLLGVDLVVIFVLFFLMFVAGIVTTQNVFRFLWGDCDH